METLIYFEGFPNLTQVSYSEFRVMLGAFPLITTDFGS